MPLGDSAGGTAVDSVVVAVIVIVAVGGRGPSFGRGSDHSGIFGSESILPGRLFLRRVAVAEVVPVGEGGNRPPQWVLQNMECPR